ncbi:uncharacterized protein LOC115772683, partial [Tachysurus ichikawai]
MMEAESPDTTLRFDGLLMQVDDELGDEDADGDDNSDLLNLGMDDEEEEDNSPFPVQQSKPPSTTDSAPPADSSLHEPAAKAAQGAVRDLYDEKRLLPTHSAVRQLLPAVPACMKEMSRYWSSPFKSKLPTKGHSMLEIQGMEELGLAGTPAVEPSVAYHLHPNRQSVSSSLQFSLEMGRQLDSGVPNPALWDEICVVNDLTRCGSGLRPRNGPGRVSGQVSQRPLPDGSEPWEKHSFAAVAARNRPPHPEERKKKHAT